MVHHRGLKPSEYPDSLFHLLEACYTGSAEDRRFYTLHHERPYGNPSWEYSRVAEIDGDLVSHACIWRFEARLAPGITITIGGIRDVCTHPDHRKKRLGHAVLDDVIAFMNREGLDASLLYAGPVPFYRAKGYVQGIPGHAITVHPGIQPTNDCNFVLRDVSITDDTLLDAVVSTREQTQDTLAFVVQRDRDYFKRLIEAWSKDPASGRRFTVITNGQGTTCGYLFMTIRDGVATIEEARLVDDKPEDAFRGILQGLGQQRGVQEIHVMLSPGHAIAKAALALGGKDEARLLTGTMARIMNVPTFVEKLVAAANVRKQGIPSKGTMAPVRLTLRERDDETGATYRFLLEFRDGRLVVAPGEAITCEREMDLTHEMLVSLLFSPLLDVDAAIDDGAVETRGTGFGTVSRLLDGWTWDKEHRDYF